MNLKKLLVALLLIIAVLCTGVCLADDEESHKHSDGTQVNGSASGGCSYIPCSDSSCNYWRYPGSTKWNTGSRSHSFTGTLTSKVENGEYKHANKCARNGCTAVGTYTTCTPKYTNDGVHSTKGMHWQICEICEQVMSAKEKHTWVAKGNHLCDVCQSINVRSSREDAVSFHYFPDGLLAECPGCNGYSEGDAVWLSITSFGDIESLKLQSEYKMLPDTSIHKSISKATVTFNYDLIKDKQGNYFGTDEIAIDNYEFSHLNYDEHDKIYRGKDSVQVLIGMGLAPDTLPTSIIDQPFGDWGGHSKYSFQTGAGGERLNAKSVSGKEAVFDFSGLSGHRFLNAIWVGEESGRVIGRLWVSGGGDIEGTTTFIVRYRDTRGRTISSAPDDTQEFISTTNKEREDIIRTATPIEISGWHGVGTDYGTGKYGYDIKEPYESITLELVRCAENWVTFVLEKKPIVHIIYRDAWGRKVSASSTGTAKDAKHILEWNEKDNKYEGYNWSYIATDDTSGVAEPSLTTMDKKHWRLRGVMEFEPPDSSDEKYDFTVKKSSLPSTELAEGKTQNKYTKKSNYLDIRLDTPSGDVSLYAYQEAWVIFIVEPQPVIKVVYRDSAGNKISNAETGFEAPEDFTYYMKILSGDGKSWNDKYTWAYDKSGTVNVAQPDLSKLNKGKGGIGYRYLGEKTYRPAQSYNPNRQDMKGVYTALPTEASWYAKDFTHPYLKEGTTHDFSDAAKKNDVSTRTYQTAWVVLIFETMPKVEVTYRDYVGNPIIGAPEDVSVQCYNSQYKYDGYVFPYSFSGDNYGVPKLDKIGWRYKGHMWGPGATVGPQPQPKEEFTGSGIYNDISKNGELNRSNSKTKPTGYVNNNNSLSNGYKEYTVGKKHVNMIAYPAGTTMHITAVFEPIIVTVKQMNIAFNPPQGIVADDYNYKFVMAKLPKAENYNHPTTHKDESKFEFLKCSTEDNKVQVHNPASLVKTIWPGYNLVEHRIEKLNSNGEVIGKALQKIEYVVTPKGANQLKTTIIPTKEQEAQLGKTQEGKEELRKMVQKAVTMSSNMETGVTIGKRHDLVLTFSYDMLTLLERHFEITDTTKFNHVDADINPSNTTDDNNNKYMRSIEGKELRRITELASNKFVSESLYLNDDFDDTPHTFNTGGRVNGELEILKYLFPKTVNPISQIDTHDSGVNVSMWALVKVQGTDLGKEEIEDGSEEKYSNEATVKEFDLSNREDYIMATTKDQLYWVTHTSLGKKLAAKPNTNNAPQIEGSVIVDYYYQHINDPQLIPPTFKETHQEIRSGRVFWDMPSIPVDVNGSLTPYNDADPTKIDENRISLIEQQNAYINLKFRYIELLFADGYNEKIYDRTYKVERATVNDHGGHVTVKYMYGSEDGALIPTLYVEHYIGDYIGDKVASTKIEGINPSSIKFTTHNDSTEFVTSSSMSKNQMEQKVGENSRYLGYVLYDNLQESGGTVVASVSEDDIGNANKVYNNGKDRKIVYYYTRESKLIIEHRWDSSFGPELVDANGKPRTSEYLYQDDPYGRHNVKRIEESELEISKKAKYGEDFEASYISYELFADENKNITEQKGTAESVDVYGNGTVRTLVFIYKAIRKPVENKLYVEHWKDAPDIEGNLWEKEYPPERIFDEDPEIAKSKTYEEIQNEFIDYGGRLMYYQLYKDNGVSLEKTVYAGTADQMPAEVEIAKNGLDRMIKFVYAPNAPVPLTVEHRLNHENGTKLWDDETYTFKYQEPVTAYSKTEEEITEKLGEGGKCGRYTLYQDLDGNLEYVQEASGLYPESVKVEFNGRARKLIFIYSRPFDLIITETTVEDAPEELHETHVLLRSNAGSYSDHSKEEYDVDGTLTESGKGAIPTSEDLYANIVSDTFLLRDQVTTAKSKDTFNVKLLLDYAETNDDITEYSTEEKTVKLEDVPYNYPSGRNAKLDKIKYATVDNDVIEWHATNEQIEEYDDIMSQVISGYKPLEARKELDAKYIEKTVGIVPRYSVENRPLLQFTLGGKIDLSKISAGVNSGKTVYIRNIVGTDEAIACNFESVNPSNNELTLKIHLNGHNHNSAKVYLDNLAQTFTHYSGVIIDLMAQAGAKVSTDRLVVLREDGTIAEIWNGKLIDLIAGTGNSYTSEVYSISPTNSDGAYNPKPSSLVMDKVVYKSGDIYVSRRMANDVESGYSTKGTVVYAPAQAVNQDQIETASFGAAIDIVQITGNPYIPEGMQDVAGNQVKVHTPVVNDSKLNRDPIINQKAVITPESDTFTYLQLDGTFNVEIPWGKINGDEFSYRGYKEGRRTNAGELDATRDGLYNSYQGYQDATRDGTDNVGNTSKTWGALKDVYIPFDTYLHLKDDTHDAGIGQDKIFIPGGEWLSVSLSKALNNDTDNIEKVYKYCEIIDTNNPEKSRTSYRFTIPVWVDEKIYEIKTRVVAENAVDYKTKQNEIPGRADQEEEVKRGNFDPAKYSVVKKHQVEVIGYIYDLQVENIEDPDWTIVDQTTGPGATGGSIRAANFPAGSTDKSSKLNDVNTKNQQNAKGAYPYAPKLGYAFAFSFKVKGRKSNEINISVSDQGFYFKSKQGDGAAKEVDLWYKEGNQYIKIDKSTLTNPALLSVAPSSLKGSTNDLPNEMAKSDIVYPGKEYIDALDLSSGFFRKINYSSKYGIGTYALINLTHPFRMVYDNMSQYASDGNGEKLYGVSKDTIINNAFSTNPNPRKDGVNQPGDERVTGSVGHWYVGYTLPVSTVAVPKGTTPEVVNQAVLKNDTTILQKNGYIIVSFGIMTEHETTVGQEVNRSNYLLYTGPNTEFDAGDIPEVPGEPENPEEPEQPWTYLIEEPGTGPTATGGSIRAAGSGGRTNIKTNYAEGTTEGAIKLQNVTGTAQTTVANVDGGTATKNVVYKTLYDDPNSSLKESSVYGSNIYANPNVITSQEKALKNTNKVKMPNGVIAEGLPSGICAIYETDYTARVDSTIVSNH